MEREGVGSDDGGRAFGAQSAPNHWAERGKAESQVCATAASVLDVGDVSADNALANL